MANDILIDSNGDLKIANGDFVVGNSSEQNVEQVLLANKGEWKQWPLIGVGITKLLNAPITRSVKKRIEKNIILQLKYDGAKNIDASFKNEIKITADYD